VTLVTLGLGIGANTAVFSVVNAVLLQPLPFEEPQRLVRLYDERRTEGGQLTRVSHSQQNFFAVREQARSFEASAAQMFQNLNIRLEEGPERIVAIAVSDGWLGTLGVRPALGRGFSPDEEQAGSESGVALVSHGFWQRRFGSDPEIVGRDLVLDGRAHTVIGVLPRGFNYPYGAEVWRPWTFDRTDGRRHFLNAQFRLKPGATIEQAQAELDTISSRLASQFPDTNSAYRIVARPTVDVFIADYHRVILVLLVAVGFVLLIACANVANLLLARTGRREKELAIRAAMGASSSRQIRQLLTENILLATAGGALGVLMAYWIRDLLLELIPPRMTSVLEAVPIDTTVLGFTLVAAIFVGALVGLIPGLRAARLDVNETLKEGGRGSGAPGRHRLLNGLVVAEMVLALVLLTGAGLMAQNLYRLRTADPGFNPDGLLSVRLSLSEERLTAAVTRTAVVQEVLDRVRALPIVQDAAATNFFPFKRENQLAAFVLEGRSPDPNQRFVVNHRYITPGFFDTLGLPVVRGRTFTRRDSVDAPGVVVISQRMARRYWPGEDPVGTRVRIDREGDPTPWLTVVGIVGDVEDSILAGDVEETWYLPYAQNAAPSRTWSDTRAILAIRSAEDPAVVMDGVRRAVWEVDPTLPLFEAASARELQAEVLSQQRTGTTLIVCFSAFGLFMAALGVYGVISYTVGQRTREFGVRVALGAQPGDIRRMVVSHGAGLVLRGLVLGLAGSLALGRYLTSVVSEISPTDPGTLAGVVVLLTGVALAASWLPARRATRVDPVVALRTE
jgi:putative ABC transport system permease protein